MFCQRAKLFRFDREANQWKEKGFGEMKILKHRVNSKIFFNLWSQTELYSDKSYLNHSKISLERTC